MCHPRWVLDGVGVKAGVIDWLIPSSNIMQMKVTGVCVCVCVSFQPMYCDLQSFAYSL